MRRDQIAVKRQNLFDRLPVTAELLRGTLLERTIRSHGQGCAKCASGEGHPLWVLTVSYPGARTRQISLRREQVPEVRRWLRNYQTLKDEIEAVCELNQQLLRADRDAARAPSKRHD
jgi:hypothetical protein